MSAIPIQTTSKHTAVFHITTQFYWCLLPILWCDFFSLSLFLKCLRLLLSYCILCNMVVMMYLYRTCKDTGCHSSFCNSTCSILQLTGQTLLGPEHLAEGQHNYINTSTSYDPEQTPADVNGRREDYGSYSQLFCPVNQLSDLCFTLFSSLPIQH